jgi:hypothetical protein
LIAIDMRDGAPSANVRSGDQAGLTSRIDALLAPLL